MAKYSKIRAASVMSSEPNVQDLIDNQCCSNSYFESGESADVLQAVKQ